MVNKRGSEFKKSAQQMLNKWNEKGWSEGVHMCVYANDVCKLIVNV